MIASTSSSSQTFSGADMLTRHRLVKTRSWNVLWLLLAVIVLFIAGSTTTWQILGAVVVVLGVGQLYALTKIGRRR